MMRRSAESAAFQVPSGILGRARRPSELSLRGAL
jgi:hypothetical protein